ncbi:MAG: hypothetical protein AAF741_01365 [Bacteroidota bacterium]
MSNHLSKRLSGLWPHWPTGAERSVFILCLAVSFLCWLILKLTLNYKSPRSFSINYTVPDDQVLLTQLPEKGRVNLEGRGWRLLSYHLWGSPLEVDYELVGLNGEGRVSAERLRSSLDGRLLATKLQLEQIEYPSAPFILSKKSAKKVPLVLDWEPVLPAGYIFKDSVRIVPDSIQLFGGQEQLASIEEWPTENVSIEWTVDDSIYRVPLAEPKQVGLKVEYDSVEIKAQLEAYIDRDFIIPITVLVPEEVDSLRIFPDHITITASIRQSLYESVSADSFQVVADLRGLPLATETGQVVPLKLEKQAAGLVRVEMERSQANYLLFE